MLFNYLKIAFRSLLKFRGYTAINLLGLALGLTAGVLIMVYVLDELSYDTFHTHADRIYRVETVFNAGNEDGGGSNDANGWPIGQILRTEFPEVESVLYTRNASGLLVNFEDRRIEQRLHYASPEFFSIFSFPLVKGDPATALNAPFSVVITEEMEQKYFAGQDALNKTLTLADTLSFVVTGVLEDIPSNSHIQLDMLLSFSTFEALNRNFGYDTGWGNINMRNYVLMRKGADVNAVSAKAYNLYMDRVGETLRNWGIEAYVVFAPLKGLYLTTKSGNGMGPVGSKERLYLVSGIAAFVILLACINFINLTTARSVYRAREVGLRKVVGSTRFALIRQFLSESFVLTCVALVVAVALSGLMLPLFNTLLNKDYGMDALFDPVSLAGIAALVVVVSFLSGYYPALVLSGMRPSEVLKGKFQGGTRGAQLRRALVVFQFVISVGLVLGTLTVLTQLDYMQKQQLGFDKDQIFVVRADRSRPGSPDAYETFKNEIGSLASTERVTFTNALPGNRGWAGQVCYQEGREGDGSISVEYMAVDEDYIATMGLQLIAGRGFDKNHRAELQDGLILNETAVTQFGFSSPEEALHKRIDSPSKHPAGVVIGVVKDYHRLGLQQDIGPLVMDYAPQYGYLYAVRYNAADTRQLIAGIEETWKRTFPGYDFDYFFLDEDFERQYQGERRLASVFGLFAVITILIAVIGLLGLVSFMVASRTKEIGVRKVLGADTLNLAGLLSREFMMLVIVANIIAFPLAWYFSDQWLQGFANRVEVSPILYVITLSIALLTTLLTISFQTVKAAMADPVKSLRYE